MAFPTGWGYYQAIVIQSSQVPSSLSDYPDLITRDHLHDDVVDPSGSNPAQADGGDLRFSTDDAGANQLPCEVVSFEHDSVTGAGDAQIEIHVKVPSVSSSVNTTIYVWYKTAGTDTQPAVGDTYGRNAVWSSYQRVWHLNNQSVTDSTGNADLTLSGTTANATGPWGAATDFADAAYADSTDMTGISGDEPLIVTAWFKSDAKGDDDLVKLAGSSLNEYHRLALGAFGDIRATSKIDFGEGADNEGGGYNTGTWYAHGGRFVGDSERRAYRNGTNTDSNTTTVTGVTCDTNVRIASGFDGSVRDVRIAAADLGDAWLVAEYNNQSSPATFATAGTPTVVSGGTPVSASHSSALESVTGLTAGGAGVVESVSAVSAAVLSAMESLLGVGVARGAVTESTSAVGGAVTSITESTSAVGGIATTVLESRQGLIAVSRDISSAVESLQSIAVARATPAESVAGLAAVSRSVSTEVESLCGVMRAQAAPFAVLAGMSRAVSGELETVARVVVSGALAAEVLTQTSQGLQVSAEALAMVSAAAGVSIEALGAGIAPTYEDLEMLLRGEQDLVMVLTDVQDYH